MRKIYLVIAREFTERVRKKSFIVTTLLMPLFMIGMMVAPSLMMLYGTSEQKQVVVVDKSGIIAERMISSEEVVFSAQNNLTKEEACQIYNAESGIFGILYINEDIADSGNVQFITNSSSSLMLEELIQSQLKNIIEREKLKLRYDIDNLDQMLADVATPITLNTFENNGTGNDDEMESTSAGINYILGIILGMLLYMVIIIYGQMVLTSVVE